MKRHAAAALLVTAMSACARGPEFDVLVRNGTVYDGTGTQQGVGRLDVGITGDRIVSIGDLSNREARLTIDADGRAIAPGFIDVYARSGTTLLADGSGESHVRQGITTEVIEKGGPEYWTSAHTDPPDRELLARFNVTMRSDSPSDYLGQLASRGTSPNIATLVPLSSLSAVASSSITRSSMPNDASVLKAALDRSMRAGAFGLSVESSAQDTSTFSDTDLTALARIVARDGGIYVTVVGPGASFQTDVRHAVAIVSNARLPLMVVSADEPGTVRSDTVMAAMASFRDAAARGIPATASITGYSTDEGDVRSAVTWPGTIVGTNTATVRADGVLAESSTRPAAFGAFPRFLGEFVRDKGLLELPEAVHRLTGLPASQLHIARRGFIREHYFADLVIFDPKTIAARATADRPNQYPSGIDYVIVNGVPVVTPRGHTGAHPGRILLGPAARTSGS